MTHDLRDGHELGHEMGKLVFWIVDRGLWGFINLNQAFKAVAGTRSRFLFEYSDVGKKTMMGNQASTKLSSFTTVLKIVSDSDTEMDRRTEKGLLRESPMHALSDSVKCYL